MWIAKTHEDCTGPNAGLKLMRKPFMSTTAIPTNKPLEAKQEVFATPSQTPSTSYSLMDSSTCNHLWKLAEVFSKSDMVPAHFHNKPANTFVALQIAARSGLDPFGVLQKCYVISGRPAFETQLAVALLNGSGKIIGPPTYLHEGKGKDRTCTATVIDAASRKPVSHTLHWATVEAEGWLSRKGSKWQTDPLLMLKYRTILQLIRTTYPEVLLGMTTMEEAVELRESDPLTLDSAAMYRSINEGEQLAEDIAAVLDSQTAAESFTFSGIGDALFQVLLGKCDSLGAVSSLEELATAQCEEDLEREWVRDMASRRRNEIGAQRSAEAETTK